MSLDLPPPSSPEQSFRVSFDTANAPVSNLELKGSGELVIRPDRGTFQFTGTNRALFSRQRKTVFFTTDDIRNVTQAGPRLSFVTSVGKSGRHARRFEFICAKPAEADLVRSLLPTRIDSEFTAELDFADRLRQLPGSASPYTSVTFLLVATNVVVFAVLAAFFDTGWFEVSSMDAYIRFGANNGAATTDGEWWRLLTSVFMHYGLIHLALNMWALMSVGELLERLLGRSLYLLLYLASGIGGSLVSIVWHGDKMWSAGASGAVFGIYGGLLGYALREKQGMPRSVWKPLQNSALTFAGYNLFYGLVHPGIDNAAHIGGLLSGLLLGWLIAVPVDLERRPALIPKKFRLGLAAAAIGIAIGITVAPRFTYRMQEEIAWEKALKGYAEKETELLQHDRQTRKLIGDDAAVCANYVRWLGAELIPFWDLWADRLAALHYTPNRDTERRRVALAEYMRTQAEAFRHLRAAIEHDDEAEIKAYNAANDRAAKIIRSMKP